MEQAKIDNYVSERGAQAYRHDHESKLQRKLSDRVERRILERYIDRIGAFGSAIDVPCGFGRFFGLLARRGADVIEADVSPTMLNLSRESHGDRAAGFLRCSATSLPLGDDAVDLAVSIRLSHHFSELAHREQHVRELMRIAKRAVIFTYFSHHSVKNTLRRLRKPFDRKRPKNTLRPTRVAELAAEAGWLVDRSSPISRLSSGHIYALLLPQPGREPIQ